MQKEKLHRSRCRSAIQLASAVSSHAIVSLRAPGDGRGFLRMLPPSTTINSVRPPRKRRLRRADALNFVESRKDTITLMLNGTNVGRGSHHNCLRHLAPLQAHGTPEDSSRAHTQEQRRVETVSRCEAKCGVPCRFRRYSKRRVKGGATARTRARTRTCGGRTLIHPRWRYPRSRRRCSVSSGAVRVSMAQRWAPYGMTPAVSLRRYDASLLALAEERRRRRRCRVTIRGGGRSRSLWTRH